MLGASSAISMVLGAAPEATADTARLKSFARACCQAGLHLLLIEPMSKIPVDVRSPQQRRRDDAKAQDKAREDGRADWDKVKSKGGVYLATDDETIICRYIEAYRKKYAEDYPDGVPINFGVAVGPSNLIVVDCDTQEQMDAFLADWAEVDPDVSPDTPPTVRSPGQRDEDGNWAHSDGGHFYFRTDERMPEYSGSMTVPGGYAVLWANRYVLIPPSVRPEGAYRLVGTDLPAPNWMTTAVGLAVSAKRTRSQDSHSEEMRTAVDEWAESVTWDDLLSPFGWVPTARQDTCGCDIWTAPGDHASPKSATAHDTGCTLGRYTTENAPIHIWTDNPGDELEAWMAAHGGKTLSRLQVAAALEYEGNIGNAMRALNVVPDDSGALGFSADQDSELGISKSNLDQPIEVPAPAATAPPGVDADPFVIAGSDAREVDTEDDEDPADEKIAGVPDIRPFSQWRDLPPPEFIVDGLIENRGFSSMVGAPGIGKSGVVLDMAAAISTGRRWMGRATMRQPVLYLPGEGLTGAVQRLLAWESAHDVDLGEDLFLGDSIIQAAASKEAWSAVAARIIELGIGLIIVDTFARATVGIEENSATEVGRAIAKFDNVREITGTGLMVVHHTGKSGGSRGSSALNGALDTEITIEDGEWWDHGTPDDPTPPPPDKRVLQARVTKQKNAAAPDVPIPMLAVNHGNSFVMTGPSGIVDDPLDGVASPRVAIPETVVSIAIRIQKFVERFPAQGSTRGEIAYGIAPDEATARRKDAKTAWRMRVNEAVDLAMRYSLVQTLTGTASGARYIPDIGTPEQARRRWAEENLGD